MPLPCIELWLYGAVTRLYSGGPTQAHEAAVTRALCASQGRGIVHVKYGRGKQKDKNENSQQ